MGIEERSLENGALRPQSPDELLTSIPQNVTADNFGEFLRLQHIPQFAEPFELPVNNETYVCIGEAKGAYAHVYFAWNKNNPSQCVVIKTINSERNTESPEVMRERLHRERSLFNEFSGDLDAGFPKVLGEGQVKLPNQQETEDYGLLEFVPGVPLKTLMAQFPDVTQKEEFIAALGYQVLQILEKMERKKYALRDINPDNIQIVHPDKNGRFVRVHDGNSIHMPEKDPLSQPGKPVGRLASITEDYRDGVKPGIETELYNLGILLYEQATGVPPIKLIAGASADSRNSDDYTFMSPAEIFVTLPKPNSELGRLISRLLAQRSKRPGIEDVKRNLKEILVNTPLEKYCG